MTAIPNTKTSRRRILIADDNPDFVESMILLLELDGHDVFGTRSGEMALDLVERQRPHMALIDIRRTQAAGHAGRCWIRFSPIGDRGVCNDKSSAGAVGLLAVQDVGKL